MKYSALYLNKTMSILMEFTIYICVEINIVLHSRIIFFRGKENLISASNISDLMHN